MKIPAIVERAAHAALAKKASDVVILDLRRASGFTDFFLLASGTSQKQVVTIAEAVEELLKAEGLRPAHAEGFPRQEWILLDYGSFVFHVFTPRTRSFYDLERLGGGATRHEVAG